MISVGSEIIDEVEESPQGGDGLLGRQTRSTAKEKPQGRGLFVQWETPSRL